MVSYHVVLQRGLILAGLLMPIGALAQPVDPVTAGAQAMALDGGQMFARMAGQIAQDRQEIDTLRGQIAALKVKEAPVVAPKPKPPHP